MWRKPHIWGELRTSARAPHICTRPRPCTFAHIHTFVTQVVARLRMLRRTGLHISAHLPAHVLTNVVKSAHVRSPAHLHTSEALHTCTRPRLCTRRRPAPERCAPPSWATGRGAPAAPPERCTPRTIQPRNAAPLVAIPPGGAPRLQPPGAPPASRVYI